MKRLAFALAVFLLAGCGPGQEEQQLEQASFAIGYELGQGLATSGWQQLDQEALWEGVEAGLKGDEPIADERAEAAFVRLQTRYQEHLAAEIEQARASGDQYLAGYLAEPDSHQTDLGVGYRVLQAGSGRYPQLSDQLLVSYRLETIEGRLVEEVSADAPISLLFGQLIPAWEEALRQMQVGERRELVVPPAAGYGDLRIAPSLAPGSTLRFVLQLHGVAVNDSEH